MLTAAVLFTLAFLASVVATEVVRGVVDARRVRRDGLGGTQDVLLWGLALQAACLVAAAVCVGIRAAGR